MGLSSLRKESLRDHDHVQIDSDDIRRTVDLSQIPNACTKILTVYCNYKGDKPHVSTPVIPFSSLSVYSCPVL